MHVLERITGYFLCFYFILDLSDTGLLFFLLSLHRGGSISVIRKRDSKMCFSTLKEEAHFLSIFTYLLDLLKEI